MSTYARRCRKCGRLLSKGKRIGALTCSDRCRVAYWRERKRNEALRAISAYQ